MFATAYELREKNAVTIQCICKMEKIAYNAFILIYLNSVYISSFAESEVQGLIKIEYLGV
jgi:hypothetical protein